jgi:DNA-directed RNA polymerase subunit N (RpoN/RPB10)
MNIKCMHCGLKIGRHYCQYYFGNLLNPVSEPQHFYKSSKQDDKAGKS